MSDVEPGDIVQAVRCSNPSNDRFGRRPFYKGAIYRIERVVPGRPRAPNCRHCGAPSRIVGGVTLVGFPPFISPISGMEVGACRCAFRKWPPPADEALRSEETPADGEAVPA